MARIRILSEMGLWSLGPSNMDLMGSDRKTHIWTSSLTVFTILEFTQGVDGWRSCDCRRSCMERTKGSKKLKKKKNLQHVNVHLGK